MALFRTANPALRPKTFEGVRVCSRPSGVDDFAGHG